MEDMERKVREVFTETIALPHSAWADFLDRRCDNPALRSRVQALLDQHVRSGEFLSRPLAEIFPGLTNTIPAQVAEFRIVREIGRGGMGVVYLAEDTVLKRVVALKVLPPHADVENATNRFRKEAQAVARLAHPGIVQIYRTGEEGGFSYIAMEYVEGQTLRSRMTVKSLADPANATSEETPPARETKRCITDFARLVSEIADALDHAHRQGVIHRDVKPSNVLIDPKGHARLTDFGLARIVSEHTISLTNDIAGTYRYMSPEQARVQSVEIDHRTDIFSLGVVFYELLTGTRPFDGATPQEILRALSESQPMAIRRLNRKIPIDLATIGHKALEKIPRDRYQTAAHMAADLRSYLNDQPILASPPTARRRVVRWAKGNRLTIGIIATCALILLVAAMAISLKRNADEKLAWLRIVAAKPCQLDLRRFDPSTLQLASVADSREISGLTLFGVIPGHYRFTFIEGIGTTGATSTEADLLLLNRGPQHPTVVYVLDDDDPWPTSGSICVRLLRHEADRSNGMVLIDAGTYDCGLGDGDRVIQHRQNVALASFYIDRSEVSNKDYLEFLYATAGSPQMHKCLDAIVANSQPHVNIVEQPDFHPNTPDYWKTAGYDNAFADHPVVGVRLDDAAAYARWKGKRLPTMFEWEAAARTASRNDYPNGRDPTSLSSLGAPEKYLRLDQARDTATRLRIYRDLSVPVTAPDLFQIANGAQHMFGNVREITSTLDLENLDGVAKGRCWLDEPCFAPLSQLWTFPINERYFDRGFRCARSATPRSNG